MSDTAYTVSGVIESARKDGKGIKVDGEWYSAFTASQLGEARYKDEVEFKVKDNTKGGRTFHNIQGDVKIVGASDSGDRPLTGVPAKAKTPAWPLPVQDSARAITRRHAISTALEYHLGTRSKASVNLEDVITTAREIEYYTTGQDIVAALEDLDDNES